MNDGEVWSICGSNISYLYILFARSKSDGVSMPNDLYSVKPANINIPLSIHVNCSKEFDIDDSVGLALEITEIRVDDKVITWSGDLADNTQRTVASNDANFYDSTQYELMDEVANVYNRLVLFNAKRIHAATKYFGDSIENARFFQLFFFDVV